MTTTTTSTETTSTTNPDFVRRQGEAGRLLETNDPRDFVPALRADGSRLNARHDPRGTEGSEDRRAFEALKTSMREQAQPGNIQPIGITPVPTFQRLRDKTLPRGYVVWGERRWAAAMDLFAEGCPVILKYIVVPEGVDQVTAMALENLARKDLSQIEKAEFVKRLRSDGKSTAEICKICGRSPAWVEQMELLASDRVAPETREATKMGRIPTTVALDMARNIEPSQQGAALREALGVGNSSAADVKAGVANVIGHGSSRPGKKQVGALTTLITAAVDKGIKGRVEVVDMLNTMQHLLEWTQGKRSNKTFQRDLADTFGDLVDFSPVFAAPSKFNKKAQRAAAKAEKRSRKAS